MKPSARVREQAAVICSVGAFKFEDDASPDGDELCMPVFRESLGYSRAALDLAGQAYLHAVWPAGWNPKKRIVESRLAAAEAEALIRTGEFPL